MTIQAIKSRMTEEIPEIDTVHAMTGEGGSEGMAGGLGGGTSPSFPGETTEDEGPEAPF
jgi:hypothetical protein